MKKKCPPTNHFIFFPTFYFSRNNQPKKMGDTDLLKFILLAKSAKGKGAVAVIQQALQSPQTFVFGELLEVPNIKAVQ